LTEKYKLTYINLFDLFRTENNELNPEFTFEGLHLNGQGYLVWKKAINKCVDKLHTANQQCIKNFNTK